MAMKIWTPLGYMVYEKDYDNLKKALNYAESEFTKACMGERTAGLVEFDMTVKALEEGKDPKKYIKEVNKEIEEMSK